MALQFLHTKFDKAHYLLNMLVAEATGSKGETSEYEALRSELLSDAMQASIAPSFLRTSRDLASFWSFIKTKFSTYAERRAYISQEFTPLLDYLEFGSVPPTNGFVASSPSAKPTQLTSATWGQPTVARNKRNVFIVHGHDNETKQEVSRFVESLGLKAIILHEQASGGMTIIEKIERYSNDADFALILYTPCD